MNYYSTIIFRIRQPRKITRAVRLRNIGDYGSDRTLWETMAIGSGSHRHCRGLSVPVRMGGSGAHYFQKSIKLLIFFFVNKFFLVCLFLFSTCFGRLSAHRQEKQLYLCYTWYLLYCMGKRLVGRSVCSCEPDSYPYRLSHKYSSFS